MTYLRYLMDYAAAIGALAAIVVFSPPARAADSIIDRWANRKVEGTFDSSKSSLALEWCIARRLPLPEVIHGDGITEIDSGLEQLGVQIAEDKGQRVITFVANPRVNDHTEAAIKECI